MTGLNIQSRLYCIPLLLDHLKSATVEIDTMDIEQSLCEKKEYSALHICSFGFWWYVTYMIDIDKRSCSPYFLTENLVLCILSHHFCKEVFTTKLPESSPPHHHHDHPPGGGQMRTRCAHIYIYILSYPWWTNSALSVSLGWTIYCPWPSDQKIWHSVSVGSKCIFVRAQVTAPKLVLETLANRNSSVN